MAGAGSRADEATGTTVAASRLGPLVPRLAAEWAASAPDEGWRVIDGTLVFADISGFTALSERLARQGPIGAEELTEVLGRGFAELLAVAYARGGSLLKFGGDALLLLFDGPGHAVRGVDAALAMRATMRRVGRLTTSVGQVRLRMSLGVHSGDVHAFRVGGSHRELLLVGPGPSTVVSMEGTADAGEIVVSPATASRVDAGLLAGGKGPGVRLRPRAEPSPWEDAPYPVHVVDEEVVTSVPVALREHLVGGGGESEHRHASIAFLHFDGTDALIAERGPAWVAAALDGLVRDVQVAVEDEGVTFLGSDLDHDGGKLILVTGVPRALGDDEGRLLRAVRRIADGDRSVPVRIGVNRGPVFAGEVGPPYRQTFTVMGDAVNLAARLMAKAGPGQILASAGVLERSRSAFSTTALAPFFVKGKSRPVQAFEVGRPRGTQETRRSAELPLVGREGEMTALASAWASTCAGEGRVVMLEGDVGVGKTRLVDELRRRAGADGAEVRLVQCEQYEAATPFFAFRVLLRAVLHLEQPTEAALRKAVRRVDRKLLDWLPLIGDVVDVRCRETEKTTPLESRFRRSRTNVVVERLLARALDRPTVLAFDDLQWIDGPSGDLLARLAVGASTRPWLLCGTRRAGQAGGPTLPATATTIPVGVLTEDETRALVRAAALDPPLPPHRVDAVVHRAGGNPLFLEELLAVAGEGDDLPETLEAVVCAQIDRLAPEAARRLRVAAVLGSSFDPALLAAVLGEDDATDAVAGLVGEHLVREADGRLRFRHRLIRDAAYELLPFRRRQELHRRAGEAILAAAGDATDEVASALALHFEHAQRHEETWRFAVVAAARADAKGAMAEAVAAYERALAAAKRLPHLAPRDVADTWVQLSIVAAIGGFHNRCRSALRAARRLVADDPVAFAGICFREARLADQTARPQDVVRWINRGLRTLERCDSEESARRRASLQSLYAYARQRAGRSREAIDWAMRVVAERDEVHNAQALAQAYLVLDWAHIDLGRPDLAVHAPDALALLEEIGEFAELAIALNNLGAFAYFQGRWEDALELYERSTDSFERTGDVVDAALAAANRAEIFTHQGRLEEAEQALVDIIELWTAMQFPYGLAIATRHLGRVRLRQGEVDDALRLFAEARATFESYGQGARLVEIDAWVAECLLHRGEVARAAELVDDALTREHAGGGTEMAPMLHRLAGYAAAAQGRLVDAWAAFDQSLHVARSRSSSYDVALALEGMATVAELGGPAAAEGHEAERRQLLEQLGVLVHPAPPVALSA